MSLLAFPAPLGAVGNEYPNSTQGGAEESPADATLARGALYLSETHPLVFEKNLGPLLGGWDTAFWTSPSGEEWREGQRGGLGPKPGWRGSLSIQEPEWSKTFLFSLASN